MADICNTCKHFRANVHPETEKPHHCDFQNQPLSDSQSKEACEECKPKKSSCGH